MTNVDESMANPRRRRRWLRWTALLGATYLLLWSGGLTWRWYRATAERDALFAQIRARGEPVFWSEYKWPEVPEKNGAKGLVEAFRELEKLERVSAYDAAQRFILEESVGGKPEGPARRPDFRAALAAARPCLSLVRSACALPLGNLRFSIRDGQASESAARSSDIRGVVRLLEVSVRGSLEAGDHRQAFADAATVLRFARQLSNDPACLGFCLRASAAGQGISLAALTLADSAPREIELRDIDDLLNEMTSTSFRQVAFGDRSDMLDDLADLPTLLRAWRENQYYPLSFSRDRCRILEWFYRTPMGSAESVEIQCGVLRSYEKMSQMVDSDDWGADRKGGFDSSKGLVERQLADGIRWRLCNDSFLRFRCRALLARYALRVARFRGQRGRLPSNVREIDEPDFRVQPVRLLNNRLPKYVVADGGFRLSVDAPIHASDETRFAVDVKGPRAAQLANARANAASRPGR